MPETAYGFAGSLTDAQFSLLDSAGPAHVSGCAVTNAAGDRTVTVASGWVKVPGLSVPIPAQRSVSLPANVSGLTRIDMIVADVTWGPNAANITYVQGTPSASPVAPTLTQQPGARWQLPLAEVRVPNGRGTLLVADVTDRRVHGGPVVTLKYGAPRPAADTHAVIIETDTGRILASNGSSYNLVKAQEARGKDSATIQSGQAVSPVQTVTFATPFLSVPRVFLTVDDSRCVAAVGSVSTTQFTYRVRWVETSPATPNANTAVGAFWKAEA